MDEVEESEDEENTMKRNLISICFGIVVVAATSMARGPLRKTRQLSVPSSVIITEIMYNPSACADSDGEWIELFNNGHFDVDIGGWTIGDSDGATSTLNSVVLAPGDYYIIARSTDGCGGLNADETFIFSLNNSGDTIILRNSGGSIVDQRTYSGSDASAGFTTQRWADVNGHPTNTWEEGQVNGSPRSGYVSPGGIAILKLTEIMYNPSECSDATGEWIELYNAGTASANLDGWTVEDNSDGSVTLAAVELPPGEYYILGRTMDGCGGLDANQTFSFSLNNAGGDTVTLKDNGGFVINSHQYSSDDAMAGHSIQREANSSGGTSNKWVEGPANGTPRSGYTGSSAPSPNPPASTPAPAPGSMTTTRTYSEYELELQCGASAGYAVRFTYELVGPDLGNHDRPSSFTKDPALPDNCQQFTTGTYSHVECFSTGRRTNPFCFDRGHLVKANHLDNDATAILESNMMTNILPQAAGFNQAGGSWMRTELLIECSRDLPNIKRQIIFGGPLFTDPSNDYFLASHGIPTSDSFWKVVIRVYSNGFNEVMSWVLPNNFESIDDNMGQYISSIAAIQALTGDAMPELPASYTEITGAANAGAWDSVLTGCDSS